MSKTPEMEKTLNEISKQLFGRSCSETIDNKVCVTCGAPADSFKDTISRAEYRISGMCQVCQDSVFG